MTLKFVIVFVVGLFFGYSPLAKGESGVFKSCTSCHKSTQQGVSFRWKNQQQFHNNKVSDKNCVGCHQQLFLAKSYFNKKPTWLWVSEQAYENISVSKTYIDIPAFNQLMEINGKKIHDPCGLIQYLNSPVPRSPSGSQSMFPINKTIRSHVLKEVGVAMGQKCEAIKPDSVRIAAGRDIFRNKNCVSCHQYGGNGPRLRLGYPFFNFDYFKDKLQGKYLNPRWSNKKSIMPVYSELTSKQLRDLYNFISYTNDSWIKPRSPSLNRSTMSFGLELYKEVQKEVFSHTCQHCHSPNKDSYQLNMEIFGSSTNQSIMAVFPREGETIGEQEILQKVLIPKHKGHLNSELIERLEIRWQEWLGTKKKNETRRGMPMTMPPIAKTSIEKLKRWTALGCPSSVGLLCLQK